VSSTTIRYSGVPENSHSHRSHSDAAAYVGLRRRVDGFYDRAGRRLLLADGSPDPMTPGAYRYQHSPDLCVLSAPEADPDSPRYEPPHLRHQPDDTGVFGSPGWQPDSRTGRHRRGELPDPIPPLNDDAKTERAVRGSEAPPLPRSPRFWGGTGRSSARSWTEEHDEDETADGEVPQDKPYRFSKLREDAWNQFLIKSEPLAAAHRTNDRTTHHTTQSALDRECGPVLRPWIELIRWVISVIRGPEPVEPAPEPQRPKPSPRPRRQPGSQMAQAINGARKARAEQEDPNGDAASERHWREQPRQERPRRPQTSPFVRDWEKHFDSGNLTESLTGNLTGAQIGGAAWA